MRCLSNCENTGVSFITSCTGEHKEPLVTLPKSMVCCDMARRYAFQYFSAASVRNVSSGSSFVLNRQRSPRSKDRCSMPGRDKRCFPAKCPHGLWGPPNGVSNGYLGALSWLLKRMRLQAVHLELVPSSRMRGVILPLPQVAVMT